MSGVQKPALPFGVTERVSAEDIDEIGQAYVRAAGLRALELEFDALVETVKQERRSHVGDAPRIEPVAEPADDVEWARENLTDAEWARAGHGFTNDPDRPSRLIRETSEEFMERREREAASLAAQRARGELKPLSGAGRIQVSDPKAGRSVMLEARATSSVE